MTGVIMTERGLGDGIEGFFQPLLDNVNEGAPDEEKIQFPALAKNILNAIFSGAVVSGFSETQCSDGNFVTFDFNDGRFDVAGRQKGHLTPTSVGLDRKSLSELQKVMVNLDPDRRDSVLEAFGLKETVGLTDLSGLKDSPDFPPLEPLGGERAVLLEPTGSCFTHSGTSGIVSRGLQSGAAGFSLAAGTVKIGLNLSYASKITIAGEEPVVTSVQNPAKPMDNFAPMAQSFTGETTGKKQLFVGGLCGNGGCSDQYVCGTAKITTIIGLRAQVAANVPKRLMDVLPQLGGDVGVQAVLAYTFRFLHYPREKPAGVPGK